MALSETEKARVNKVVGEFIEERRPPPHLRSQVDLAFRITGQSVEIFEVRPKWQGRAGEIMEQSVAKATFSQPLALWKIYWKRADLKWHAYTPTPQVGTIEKFVELVEADAHSCFFG